jgi:hypothetical protein
MFLPHRKHYIYVTDASRLIRFRKIIAVYSENHTKQIFWVAKMQSFVMLKQVVHVVTTVKQWVNSHKKLQITKSGDFSILLATTLGYLVMVYASGKSGYTKLGSRTFKKPIRRPITFTKSRFLRCSPFLLPLKFRRTSHKLTSRDLEPFYGWCQSVKVR